MSHGSFVTRFQRTTLYKLLTRLLVAIVVLSAAPPGAQASVAAPRG